MTTIPFTKMVGTGNDFVVVDARRHRVARQPVRWSVLSQTLCDRRHGIGADGVLVLEPSKVANVKMRVLNPDGSEAEMCGNGARCVALYVKNGTRGDQQVTIETMAGIVSARVHGERVAMRMTDPTGLRLAQMIQVDGKQLRYGFVNTGVPHAVVWVERLDRVDVERLGRALRSHRRFSPQGANVDFMEPGGRQAGHLRLRTYERGVEAETLACGTGVVAAAVVFAVSRHLREGQRKGWRSYRIEVGTRSGEALRVLMRVRASGGGASVTDVVLEGSAVRVFDGTVTWPLRKT